ncbi:MAG: NADH-quinone oxidoreductase subunit J [Planctomycetes bacterium]|nr:NADH-quinone oxidoreductase subunit J [Planctomycetota bacterium]
MIHRLKGIGQDVLSDPVFAACAAVAIGAALLMVTRRNPVYAALWLMQCFLAVAVVFLKLHAPFLAAIHVLVYTGAILVLFLFVIMLLSLQPHELGAEHSRAARALGALVCAGFLAVLGAAALHGTRGAAPLEPLRDVAVESGSKTLVITAEQWGGVEHVGAELFSRFVVPFEVVSILILVAILGAVVLAKRKL